MENTPATTTARALALADDHADPFAAWRDSLRPATLAAYLKDLEHFAKWAAFAGVCDDATPEAALDGLAAAGNGRAQAIVRRWMADLEAAGLAPRTIARRLSALKSPINFLAREWGLGWTLTVRGPKAGAAVRDTRGPGEAKVGAVLRLARELAETGGPAGTRDAAILALLTGHALRRSELVGLNVEHVELDGETPRLWVLGKGRGERAGLTLSPEAAEALGAWLKVRGGEAGDPLFVGVRVGGQLRETRLDSGSVARITKKLAKLAGEAGRFNPHGFRHTAITRCARMSGGDLAAVTSFSRHADVRTVALYVDNLRDQHGSSARMVSAGWGA